MSTWFSLLFVFWGGFVIMVLEIVGARYLARDFGGSFYVWISQIGVILIALALGYAAGGYLADRFRRARFLFLPLVLTAGVTFAIPQFTPGLIQALIDRHPVDQAIPLIWQKLDPALGSTLVFFLPCFVLATLAPYTIRLNSHQLDRVGTASGIIYAASTAGSIAGVFVSGYILIDYLKVSAIFQLTGGLTLGLAALALLLDRICNLQVPAAPSTQAAATATILILATMTPLHAGTVFEADSPYHHIRVEDQRGVRMLRFNASMETRMSLQNHLQGHFEYTEYFHLPWLWNTNIQHVLTLGLGGGSIQRAYQHYYPKVSVDAVEMDPMVIDVAQRFFGVRTNDNLRIINHDGRVYLRRTEKKYDVILVDAYTSGRYGSSIPPHLTTTEFFELASARLKPNGVLAYNCIGYIEPRANIVSSLYRTLGTVFPNVYTCSARSSQNVVLLATKSDDRPTPQALAAQAQALVNNGTVTVPGFLNRASNLVGTPPPALRLSPVLTDDHAPVERLMNAH